MGKLEYEKSSHQWAWEKGMIRKCKHGTYDPNIGCKKCDEENGVREEKKRRLKEAFDNVVWPDK